MGVLEVLVGAFVLIIVMVILMQPILVLSDVTDEKLDSASNTIKQGTDADGNIVDVGSSSALPGITQAGIIGIGLFIAIGFIIWAFRSITRESGGSDEFL